MRLFLAFSIIIIITNYIAFSSQLEYQHACTWHKTIKELYCQILIANEDAEEDELYTSCLHGYDHHKLNKCICILTFSLHAVAIEN